MDMQSSLRKDRKKWAGNLNEAKSTGKLGYKGFTSQELENQASLRLVRKEDRVSRPRCYRDWGVCNLKKPKESLVLQAVAYIYWV